MRLHVFAAIASAIGLAEWGSYCWMHPAKDPNAPPPQVLTFDWAALAANCTGPDGTLSATDNGSPTTDSSSSHSSTDNRQPITDQRSTPPPRLTLLSDEATANIEALSSTDGEVARIDFEGSGTLYLAWFEWDNPDRSAASHIFYHMPDGCMGGKGFRLIEVMKPRTLWIGEEQVVFDQTRFETPSAQPVYVFKAVWAAGMAIDEETLLEHRRPQMRRLQIVRQRKHISHGRVLMGTFHGFTSRGSAWQAFEESVLPALTAR